LIVSSVSCSLALMATGIGLRGPWRDTLFPGSDGGFAAHVLRMKTGAIGRADEKHDDDGCLVLAIVPATGGLWRRTVQLELDWAVTGVGESRGSRETGNHGTADLQESVA